MMGGLQRARQMRSTHARLGTSAHHEGSGGSMGSTFAARDIGKCFETLGLMFVLTTLRLCRLDVTAFSGLRQACQESSSSSRQGMSTWRSTGLGIGGMSTTAGLGEYGLVLVLSLMLTTSKGYRWELPVLGSSGGIGWGWSILS